MIACPDISITKNQTIMARRCRSCDGILGVDCFNESECEYISHQMEMQKENDSRMQIHYLEMEVESLKAQKAELLEALGELHKVVSEYEDLVCSEAPSTHRNAMNKARQAITKAKGVKP